MAHQDLVRPVTEENYKPHWKGKVPIPKVDLYARPRGNVQWECTFCGNLHSSAKGFWRRGKVQCMRAKCERKFRLGVGITKDPDAPKALWQGKFFRGVANKLDPQPMDGPVVNGRIYGTIDWKCRECKKVQTGVINFFDRLLVCEHCHDYWYVQLLMYHAYGFHNIVPYDWTVFYVEEFNKEPVLTEAFGESPGTASPSPGNHSKDSHK